MVGMKLQELGGFSLRFLSCDPAVFGGVFYGENAETDSLEGFVRRQIHNVHANGIFV